MVYKNVEECLLGKGCIAIFPEGGSHDQTYMLPFKAGIAMMALSSAANSGLIPIIIPSGLKYFK